MAEFLLSLFLFTGTKDFTMRFEIKKVTQSEKNWVLEIVRQCGADFIVSRGRKIYPTEIEAFYAVNPNGMKVGLVSYEVIDGQCEVVTLDAFEQFQGAGTALINEIMKLARSQGWKRIWLITTNDNLDAIRFYQRRGFTIAAIHKDALKLSRKLKPSIPEIGRYGIPMCDEIEFEMFLEQSF